MPALLLFMDCGFSCIVMKQKPVHVHVINGGSEGKLWLEPDIKIAYLNENKWYEYFNK